MSRPDPRALHALARHHGVQRRYTAASGQRVTVSDGALVGVLRALGVELDGAEHAGERLRAYHHDQARQLLAPVVVHRAGSHRRPLVPVGAGEDRLSHGWVTLVTEAGDEARKASADVCGPDGIDLSHLASALPGGQLPFGYHRLSVESPTTHASTVVIAAPDRCPAPARSWGVMAPLYALRGSDDWGAGSLADLRALAEWVRSQGAGLSGTLPLYAGFLTTEGPDADPSPYRPASRLAWNEAYIDVDGLPELAQASKAVEARRDPALEERIEALRGEALADLAGVVRAKRQVLQAVASAVFDPARPGSQSRRAYDRWALEHPDTVAYAAFRARLEHGIERSRPAGQLPDPSADGAMAYHCYVQWAMDRQLAEIASRHDLYLDIPVGVHPEGFDPFYEPDAFATEASIGAPPDDFFTQGQRWGLPPLHPDGLRRQGYRHLAAVLRQAMTHAGMVRLDHVMGLHRIWVVPEGAEARHGAYVRYHAEELRAVVVLEAARARAVVVGEDLGTVPGAVRRAMRRDGMLRSSVWQFDATARQPLPDPAPGSLASLGTHDLPPFAAVLAERPELRRALGADDFEALARCLAHLGASAAPVVLVDLADLWLEQASQNRPGTAAPENFRLRARRTLAELRDDPQVTALLRAMAAARRAGTGALEP